VKAGTVSSFTQADFTIPVDSARIHGITTDRANAEGVSLYKVLPQFNADVEKADTVVAHNLDFDLPVVTTEFVRCRLETGLADKHSFCTMKTPQVVSWCKLPFKVRPGIQVADLKRAPPPVVPGRIHRTAIMPAPMWKRVRDVILN